MPCSPARLAANQRNARKSTGPRTDEGKARSRANSLKHGMTGVGIVLPPEDVAEVDALAAQLEQEMKPSGAVGRILLRRVAAMSTRLDRCAEHEAVMTAKRVRDAANDRDNARRAEVEAIGVEVMTNPRDAVFRLKQTPEGIDWLIRAWQALLWELEGRRRFNWDHTDLARVDNLLGRVSEEYPPTAFSPLCRAALGDLSGLAADQGPGLTRAGRRAWACEQLRRMIDAEVEALRDLRAEVDGEDEAIDRAEAAGRALFDPSKEGQLARKYEANAERTLFQALREFHKVEDKAKAVVEPAPIASSTVVPTREATAVRPRASASPSVPAPTSRPAPADMPPPAPAKTDPTSGGWGPAIGGPG